MFISLSGVAKAQSSSDYAMLEYCVREDLKPKAPRYMAVIDPIKLVIDNYPQDQVEWMEASNNPENEEMGTRTVPFCSELYIEREDFMEEPPKKYFRLYPGNEVRLMNAYFVTCTSYEKDENGVVTTVHCTYDPETRSGSGFNARKVKGTIHWVSARHCTRTTARLYEQLIDEERNINPDSLTVMNDCMVEPELAKAQPGDRFQFVRNGYFAVDTKDSVDGKLVFNRIVSLKSSFKL